MAKLLPFNFWLTDRLIPAKSLLFFTAKKLGNKGKTAASHLECKINVKLLCCRHHTAPLYCLSCALLPLNVWSGSIIIITILHSPWAQAWPPHLTCKRCLIILLMETSKLYCLWICTKSWRSLWHSLIIAPSIPNIIEHRFHVWSVMNAEWKEWRRHCMERELMIRQCGFAVKAGRGSVFSCFGMRGLKDESEPLCVDIMMGGGFREPL